jgi:predicted porin
MYDQAASVGGTDNRARLGAKYDFGSFKLGGAYEQRKFWNAGNRTDMGVSAGTSMGALTLGANYVSRKWDNVPTQADGTITGYSVSASYALSKRTSVNTNYASWNATTTDANRANELNLVLSHSF